jgi:hypothetical protein
MLSINVNLLLTTGMVIGEDGTILAPAPDTERVTTLLRSAWSAADPQARLMLVTLTMGGSLWEFQRDWVRDQLEQFLPDADPAVDAAIRRLLAFKPSDEEWQPFAEVLEFEDWPILREQVSTGAAIAVLLRDALNRRAEVDVGERFARILRATKDPPPQLFGRTRAWPADRRAEQVAGEWVASGGFAELWGLFVLGRLRRDSDASPLIGPALRSGDRLRSRTAASAIQSGDCRRVEWLVSALTDHSLEGGDDETYARLRRTLDSAIVDVEDRRRVGRLAADTLDFVDGPGARELAETLLFADWSESD